MKASFSPELVRLLKKRAALITDCIRMNEKADLLQFTKRHKELTASAMQSQAADRAFVLNEQAILTFKARSIQDVIAKLQIVAEVLLPSPGESESNEEMGFHLAIEDLRRLLR
jgi:hypothetical protein